MELKRVKKRYIIGVIVIVFILWRCTASDEDDYAQQRQEQAADAARYQANQEAQAAGQMQPYAPAPQQPIIVNTQPQESHDHFWDYVMLHHLFNSNHQPAYVPHYQARTRNVTNITNVTHIHQAPQNFTAPAAPKSGYQTPVKQPSSKWSQPGVTARSYTVSAPAPSSMKNRTWSTSSSKGWGSSTSYKPSSGSYSYRSSSSSFRSSGFRSSRR